MKPPVVAYAAYTGPLGAWPEQLALLADGYAPVAISAVDQALHHLRCNPTLMLAIQVDRDTTFLEPVFNLIESRMPDLPVIGFVREDENALLRRFSGLSFYFKGKIVSARRLHEEIERAFHKFGDGGELNSISPGMLLQLIEMERKSCTVRLFDSERSRNGTLFFRDGCLHDARLLETRGRASALEIASWRQPSIWIENYCPDRPDTIGLRNKAILVEAMRRQDAVNAAIPPPAVPDEKDSDHRLMENGGRSTKAGATIPKDQEMSPRGGAVNGSPLDRVAAALPAADVGSEPQLASLAKQLSLAGSIMEAGRLRCGFMAPADRPNRFFVCLDETVGIRIPAGHRREGVLDLLFRMS